MAGSGALLAELERSGLFISVDSAGDWYEQHQLVADAAARPPGYRVSRRA